MPSVNGVPIQPKNMSATFSPGKPFRWFGILRRRIPSATPLADGTRLLVFILKFLDMHPVGIHTASGEAHQLDATQLPAQRATFLFSTDPPYYDNIGYADLSDFFYVWLRRCLSKIYPQLFSTILVPKKQELVAAPERFEGNRAEAQRFFEEGFVRAFGSMRAAQHKDYPLTVYYAFKQAETDDDDESGKRPLQSLRRDGKPCLKGSLRLTSRSLGPGRAGANLAIGCAAKEAMLSLLQSCSHAEPGRSQP